jgi:lipopolysaccharide transport system permease protein
MATVVTSAPVGIVQHLSPLALARNLWRHRELIRQFTRREVQGRYRGSMLGLLWSLINPLVLLLIYTFVFGIVFKARWPHARTTSLEEFALVLFCGITTFGIFSECVGRSPGLVISVPNYVKKVVFPLEVLPVSVLGAALFHALVSLAILVVGNLLIGGGIQWTIVLLPLVVLPLIFLGLGLSWLFASLGVFIRDINYAIGLILQVLFFGSAVFYSPETVPEPFGGIVALNPLTGIVDNVRRVVLWGMLPDWARLAFWLPVTGVIMLLGYAWFMKTKKAFADVI